MEFCHLNKAEKEQWLPRLFELLYENMSAIAPSGLSYEKERQQWLAAVSPALDKAPRQIILCLAEGAPVGYVQYYIREKMLMVEEVQLKREYHRTFLFYRLCRYLLSVIPEDLQTVEAYADRRNLHSIRLMGKLGMEACDDGCDSPFVHMRGRARKIYAFFSRKAAENPVDSK